MSDLVREKSSGPSVGAREVATRIGYTVPTAAASGSRTKVPRGAAQAASSRPKDRSASLLTAWRAPIHQEARALLGVAAPVARLR